MSALDFTARALAMRATALTPLTLGELPQAQLPGNVTRIASSGHAEPGNGAAVYVSDSLATAALQAAHPAAVFRERGGRYFRLAFEDQGHITPEQFGWTETNNDAGQIITDALSYQTACSGMGTVALTPGRTYELSNLVAAAVNDPAVPHVLRGRSFLRPGNRIEGRGATLQGAYEGGYALVSAYSEMRSIHEVTGPMAAGERVFRLAMAGEAAQFEVGDDVLWRLGEITTGIDAIEPLSWGWAKVEAIDVGAGEITLDRGLPRAWDGASPNGYGKWLRRMMPLSGLVYDDVSFASPSNSEPLIYGGRIYAARDVRVTSVRGKGCGAGTMVLQYAHNFHIDYCEGAQNNYNAMAQPWLPSGGRGISIAESTGRIDHLEVSDCYMQGAFVEFNSNLSIGYLHDVVTNSDNGTGGTNRHKGIYANWNSPVHVERALFEGGSNFYTHESARATNGKVTFGDVRVVASGAPYILPVAGYDCNRLELVVDGAEELYLGSRARWIEQTIFLSDGMTFATGRMDFGHGLVVACHAVFGGGAVAGDFSNFYVGRVSHAVDLKSTLVPAAPSTAEVNLITAYAYGVYVAGATTPQFGSGAGALNWADRAEVALVRVVTPAGSSLAGSGKYVRIRMLIVPNELGGADPGYSTARIARETQGMIYEGQAASAALNASIAAGATASQTIAVTGLAAGDLADASFSDALNAGLLKTVQAVANGVKVSLTNPTAEAIAGPGGTIHAQGRKRRLGA